MFHMHMTYGVVTIFDMSKLYKYMALLTSCVVVHFY